MVLKAFSFCYLTLFQYKLLRKRIIVCYADIPIDKGMQIFDKGFPVLLSEYE